MLRVLVLAFVLASSAELWAQSGQPSSNQTPANQTPTSSSSSNSPDTSKSSPRPKGPEFAPPRSDTVDADSIPGVGESSSKDNRVDLSPPEDDAKRHPQSSEAVSEAEGRAGGNGVGEFRPWDPHKAAKSVEVGDFYFKRKNYKAAEDRYREALYYKDNDAVATFRLAVCLEKTDRRQDAVAMYESYLKILPHGPQAEDAHKAIERLKTSAANSKPGK